MTTSACCAPQRQDRPRPSGVKATRASGRSHGRRRGHGGQSRRLLCRVSAEGQVPRPLQPLQGAPARARVSPATRKVCPGESRCLGYTDELPVGAVLTDRDAEAGLSVNRRPVGTSPWNTSTQVLLQEGRRAASPTIALSPPISGTCLRGGIKPLIDNGRPGHLGAIKAEALGAGTPGRPLLPRRCKRSHQSGRNPTAGP